MEVRLAKNRLQLAQLEEKKQAIELAERQAHEAEERERERRERLAREEREEREEQEQKKRMAERRKAQARERQQAARDAQSESFDFWGAVLDGMQNSGWGTSGYAGGCGPGQSRVGGAYGGACIYVDPNTGMPYRSYGESSSSTVKCGRLASCRCDDSCSTFAYPVFGKPDFSKK